MLHKCVNLSCSNLFRRLQQGKLFQVEAHYLATSRGSSLSRRNQLVRQVERYWLCDKCASKMTLSFERGEVVTVPIPQKRPMPVPLETLSFAAQPTKVSVL